MSEIEFTIKVTMNERWVDDFCSMLKWMEACGKAGHSSMTGFYADGDGDFRPTFEIDAAFDKKNGIRKKDRREQKMPEMEIFFDAG